MNKKYIESKKWQDCEAILGKLRDIYNQYKQKPKILLEHGKADSQRRYLLGRLKYFFPQNYGLWTNNIRNRCIIGYNTARMDIHVELGKSKLPQLVGSAGRQRNVIRAGKEAYRHIVDIAHCMYDTL